MRELVYGMIFGAAMMYFYEFHGHRVQFFVDYLNTNRDWAVEETKKYK